MARKLAEPEPRRSGRIDEEQSTREEDSTTFTLGKKRGEKDNPEFACMDAELVEQNRQGSVSLRGDILMVIDGETILIKGFEEK